MCVVQYESAIGSDLITWKAMPTGYPMLAHLDDDVVRANLTVRVPRDRVGDRITVMALVVEPGYISSEHVKPGVTSAAPPGYLGHTLVASVIFITIAAMFSRR